MMTPTDSDTPMALPANLNDPDFEEDPAPGGLTGTELVVSLTAFQGPLDVLLDLARRQKVDLLKVSVLELAEQYLVFVAEAKQRDLELAAEYLVMAAWLAYLKSRLLLPPDETDEDEVSPEEMARRLALRLKRLEAMRRAADDLWALDLTGRDVFVRGAPEGVRIVRDGTYAASLYDLLDAYARLKRKQRRAAPVRVQTRKRFGIDEALIRLRRVIGDVPDWTVLSTFLPEDMADPVLYREAVASTLVAALEMARHGQVELRQGAPFAPLYLKRGIAADDVTVEAAPEDDTP